MKAIEVRTTGGPEVLQLVDVRSDERLKRELDRVLDAVNGLELDALQQGDAQPKTEPAPIDETNEVT